MSLIIAVSLGALALAQLSCETAKPRLLILITADTLRADRLGAYGSDLQLTPNLDALARESLVFRRVYAPTSFTLPSVSALLTGRYPEELGIQSNRSALPAETATLATLLRESGWSTAAVVSNFVLQRNAGLARGFDRYDDELPQRELGRDWPERIAADTTDAALELLDSLLIDSPPACFLWIHYQDPHGPYTPPEGYRSRTLETERRAADGRRRLPIEAGRAGQGSLPRYQEIGDEREVAFYRAGYNGEVAYLDEQIGRLIRGLRERGLDEAALVFTSDHGEALGEDDYWFAHGDRLTDPLVHVPLMIRAPDVGPGQRDDVASLVDLFPTLLAMAAESPHASTGRDLLRTDGAANSEPYLATLGAGGTQRYGIVSGSHKLILTRVDDHWDPRLYQRDPLGGERPQRAPETAQRLVGRLMEFREQLPRGKPELRQKLSDEDAERLRALGYGVSDPDHE